MASAWKRDRPNARGHIRSTVYFRHPQTGAQVTDGTYPLKIATERVRKLAASLDDPEFTNPRLGREPLRVYAEHWFAARPVMASTRKIRSYLDSQLLPAFGAVPLKDIDRFLVQEWVERLMDPEDPDARPAAAESIHSYYATLSTIMKFAAIDRHIPVSRIGKGTVILPSKGLDTRVFLTLDQLEALLELVSARLPHWYPMIKLTAETGARWGEIAGLTLDKLDLARGSLLIDQSLKLDGAGAWTIGLPKGGRWRRIGIEPDTCAPLQAHLAAHPPSNHQFDGRAHALLFTTPDGQALDRNNFRRDVWKPLVDGVPRLTRGLRFHDLRYSHISILLDLGTPVGDVSTRAGHASKAMTQDRYGHSMPHSDDRAMSRLADAKAAAANGCVWCPDAVARPRPWQVLRQRVALKERSSSRSFFDEDEAVRAAVDWCADQPSAVRPLAHVLNRTTSPHAASGAEAEDALQLCSQSYLVQYDADGAHLMLGTWPAVTPSEQESYVRWAAGGGNGARPKGGPT